MHFQFYGLFFFSHFYNVTREMAEKVAPCKTSITDCNGFLFMSVKRERITDKIIFSLLIKCKF